MGKKKNNQNQPQQQAPYFPPGTAQPPPGAVFGYPPPPVYEPPSPDKLEEMALNAEIKANEASVKRLKRIQGPCSITGCLLYFLFFIVISFVLIFFIIFLFVDRFEIITLIRDIDQQFRISAPFRALGNFFRNLFGRGGDNGEEPYAYAVRYISDLITRK